MELSQQQNNRALANLLLLTAASQAIYTALYVLAKDAPRLWLWGIEGLLFVVLATAAGAALVQAKQSTLAYSAILVSAILNVVQVGIGLTQFGPFREASQGLEALAPAAGSVVALSFFIYNAAKVALGLAAVVLGTAVVAIGATALGRTTVVIGWLAILSNAIVMILGRIPQVPSGALGVLATVLLGLCLLKLMADD